MARRDGAGLESRERRGHEQVLLVTMAEPSTTTVAPRVHRPVLIQRQTVQIARQLTDAETDLEAAFGRIKSITTWLAEEGHALAAVQKPEDVDDENTFFQGIVTSFGLDLIYIMNV